MRYLQLIQTRVAPRFRSRNARWSELWTPRAAVPHAWQRGVNRPSGTTAIQAQDVVGYGASAAVYLIAAYPVMLLFIIMQKYFMRGIMEGGLKF